MSALSSGGFVVRLVGARAVREPFLDLEVWTMKYMFLLQTADGGPPEDGTLEAAQMYADYQVALQAMAQAGVLIDCAPLQGASRATTVRVRDGQTMLTDGPAAELKEQVGGYTLVECADLDEALKYAAMIPAARAGSVEVRPVSTTQAPTSTPAPVESDSAQAGAVSS